MTIPIYPPEHPVPDDRVLKRVLFVVWFLVAALVVVLVAVVVVKNQKPSVDVQTDIRRVTSQCGQAATLGMGATHPFVKDGKDYFPQYNGQSGYIAIIDRQTGEAQCYDGAPGGGSVLGN